MEQHEKILLEYAGVAPGSREIESVWATPVAEGFVIDNIPFRAQGIALGDLISAEKDEDGMLHFRTVVRPSGHSTVRLWFSKAHEHLVPAVRKELRQRGCRSELSDLPRLVAVDVPPDIPYEQVKEYFVQCERNGFFEYEEGCLGQADSG